jgi:hypothetical protein
MNIIKNIIKMNIIKNIIKMNIIKNIIKILLAFAFSQWWQLGHKQILSLLVIILGGLTSLLNVLSVFLKDQCYFLMEYYTHAHRHKYTHTHPQPQDMYNLLRRLEKITLYELCLPPHTSHHTQQLDARFLFPLYMYYGKQIKISGHNGWKPE